MPISPIRYVARTNRRSPRRFQPFPGYHEELRTPWPQPSFIPQTRTVALDTFNAGATQLLTARPGWDPLASFSVAPDISLRTDAVPTVADATLAPTTTAHSNLWADRMNNDGEVWFTWGTVGGTNQDISCVYNAQALSSAGTSGYLLRSAVAANGIVTLENNFTTLALLQTQAIPVTGDSFCLQREGIYLFGWKKPAAGSWTLLLSVVNQSFQSGGYIGLYFAGASTSTVDSFGGGSFYSRNPHQNSVRQVWSRG